VTGDRADGEPFTPEAVKTMLSQIIISPNSRVQSKKKIEELVFMLKWYRQFVQMRKHYLGVEKINIKHIHDAIQILILRLPTERDEYAVRVDMIRRHIEESSNSAEQSEALLKLENYCGISFKHMEKEAKKDLHAFDLLLKGVEAVQARNLPLLGVMELSAAAENWHDIRGFLADLFHRTFPDQSNEAGYRFLVWAIPKFIPSVEPTFETIKSAFKKEGVVKRWN
jgi:hypothetical protein